MPSKLKEDLKLDIERFIKDHQDWTNIEIGKHWGVSPHVAGQIKRDIQVHVDAFIWDYIKKPWGKVFVPPDEEML